MAKLIISIKETRRVLGKSTEKMSDKEIENTIETLDLLALQALKQAEEERLQKQDAQKLAELTYDIYKESQNQ